MQLYYRKYVVNCSCTLYKITCVMCFIDLLVMGNMLQNTVQSFATLLSLVALKREIAWPYTAIIGRISIFGMRCICVMCIASLYISCYWCAFIWHVIFHQRNLDNNIPWRLLHMLTSIIVCGTCTFLLPTIVFTHTSLVYSIFAYLSPYLFILACCVYIYVLSYYFVYIISLNIAYSQSNHVLYHLLCFWANTSLCCCVQSLFICYIFGHYMTATLGV